VSGVGVDQPVSNPHPGFQTPLSRRSLADPPHKGEDKASRDAAAGAKNLQKERVNA
jgi:hypothetical protein